MAWASTPPCSPRPGYFSVSGFTESSDIVSDFPWGRPMKSQGFHRSADARWRRLLYGKRRHPVGFSLAGLRPLVLIGGILPPGGASDCCFTESSDVVSDFPWGGRIKSRGFHPSAGAHWRHPVAGWSEAKRSACPVASAPGFLSLLHAGRNRTPNERGGARALERAPKASAARRAEAQRTGSERRPGWPT